MTVSNRLDAKLFVLNRIDDESGVSGTGIVAEGVEFSDGTAVLRWRSHIASTAVYDSIRALNAIHGHDGKTKVRYLNPLHETVIFEQR
jgi:hypothetical protein